MGLEMDGAKLLLKFLSQVTFWHAVISAYMYVVVEEMKSW